MKGETHMELEDIINQMITKTGKSRNEIHNLIETKQSDAGGSISEKAAAALVSKDLGLDLTQMVPSQLGRIADLHHMAPGSSNIIIAGVVDRIYYPHQFQKDQEARYVQNLILKDATGTIRLVLWGSMVLLTHKLQIKKGDTIRVMKGFLKNGRLGEREVHLNDSAMIDKNVPTDVLETLTDIDVWTDVLLPGAISKEHTKDREIDVQGIVVEKMSVVQGRPLSVYLVDPSPSPSSPLVRLVVWGERIDDYHPVQTGQKILVEGVRVKEGLNNELELNFSRWSNLTVLSEEQIPLPEELKNKIGGNQPATSNASTVPSKQGEDGSLGSLEPQMFVKLAVRVAWVGRMSTFNRRDGSEGRVIRLGIYDNTGSNHLVLWDKDAEEGANLHPGDAVVLTEAYLKSNRGQFEVHLGRNGRLEKPPSEEVREIPTNLPPTPINAIDGSWKMASLYGEISDISTTRTFQRTDGSEGQVRSLTLTDNTGDLRVVAWDELAQAFDPLTEGETVGFDNLRIKTNQNGEFDAHLTQNTEIFRNPAEDQTPEWAKDIKHEVPIFQPREESNYNRILLHDLTNEWKESVSQQEAAGGDLPQVEFRAIIADVDDRWVYYPGCPECGKKVEPINDTEGQCPNHGQVHSVPKLLLRITFDDGTGTLSTSLLGTVAERVTGYKPHQLTQFLEDHNYDAMELLNAIKQRIQGVEFIIQGKLGVRSGSGESDRVFWDFRVIYVSQASPEYELQVLESQV